MKKKDNQGNEIGFLSRETERMRGEDGNMEERREGEG